MCSVNSQIANNKKSTTEITEDSEGQAYETNSKQAEEYVNN
jgi:hypothetical protein